MGLDVFCLRYLGRLGLSAQVLYMQDLFGANLRQADLSGACLGFGVLLEANLSGADLRGAGVAAGQLRNCQREGARLDPEVESELGRLREEKK